MILFTKEIEAKLRKNAEHAAKTGESGPVVVKIFDPCGAATWLLSDMDEDGRCFGLCDLGMGFPELGYVHRSELERFKGPLGIGLERDKYFEPKKSLREYADEARIKGSIAA